MISAIVAMDKNGVIGKDGKIPWHLPKDLKYFKEKTWGHPVIMGRKSFESIGKPLKGRTNIVVSRDPHFEADCLTVNSIELAIKVAKYKEGWGEIFIIGGREIYQQTMQYWNRLYLTRVHCKTDGDTRFPTIDFKDWKLISEDREDECTFQIYEKI